MQIHIGSFAPWRPAINYEQRQCRGLPQAFSPWPSLLWPQHASPFRAAGCTPQNGCRANKAEICTRMTLPLAAFLPRGTPACRWANNIDVCGRRPPPPKRAARSDHSITSFTSQPMTFYRATPPRSFRFHIKDVASTTFVAAMIFVTGCNTDLNPEICGTGDVYACARLQTIVSADSVTLPPSHLVSLKVAAARTNATWESENSAVPTVGASQVNLYFHAPLTPTSVDTITVWVVAQLIELPIPPVPNVPSRTVAVDSVRHLLRFARSGARIVPDTVHLRLRKP